MKEIVLTSLSTGAFLGFIQFLISRQDNKDESKKKLEKVLEEISEQLTKNEKDTLRTQLLLLLLIKPQEVTEILRLAERYFSKPPKGLGGNWYMTSIFKNWLVENGVGKPEWFDSKE